MTTNEIINRLRELEPSTTLIISDDFGNLLTSDFNIFSWRGSYNLPAIEVVLIDSSSEGTTAETAITNLVDCEGDTLFGWKGGEFQLDFDDEVYLVAHSGTSGNCTSITSISDSGWIEVNPDSY